MKRRTFLNAAGVSTANYFFPNCLTGRFDKGLLVCSFQGKENGLLFLDIDRGTARKVLLESAPHIPMIFKTHSNFVVGAKKFSNSLSIFNRSTMEEVGGVKSPSGTKYFGHSCIAPDGDSLFCSLVSLENSTPSHLYTSSGSVAQVSLREKKVMRHIETNTLAHDILYIPGTDKIVTAGGDSLIFLSSKDGKIREVKKIFNFDNPFRTISHLHISNGRRIVFQVNTYLRGQGAFDGELCIADFNGELLMSIKDSTWTTQNHSEIFSISSNLSGHIVGVVLPDLNEVSFWSTLTGAKLASHKFVNPRSVLLSNDYKTFVVTSEQGVTLVDASDLSQRRDLVEFEALFKEIFAGRNSKLRHVSLNE